jgi:hypothetical protein
MAAIQLAHALTLAAIWLGIAFNSVRDERAAVTRMHELGGKMIYDCRASKCSMCEVTGSWCAACCRFPGLGVTWELHKGNKGMIEIRRAAQ